MIITALSSKARFSLRASCFHQIRFLKDKKLRPMPGRGTCLHFVPKLRSRERVVLGSQAPASTHPSAGQHRRLGQARPGQAYASSLRAQLSPFADGDPQRGGAGAVPGGRGSARGRGGSPGSGARPLDTRPFLLFCVFQEWAVTPNDQTLFPDVDWLIGNHSDELTPWIPVIAAR